MRKQLLDAVERGDMERLQAALGAHWLPGPPPARAGRLIRHHALFFLVVVAVRFLFFLFIPESKSSMSKDEVWRSAKDGDLGQVQALVGTHPDWVKASDSDVSV